MKTRTKAIILLCVGIVLLVAGILFLTLFKELIRDEVHEQVVLKLGTETWKGYANPPFPILFKFWFFNCTNCGDERLGLNFKPNLVDVGPYVLDLKWGKLDPAPVEGYKLRYNSHRTWYLLEDDSNGTFADNVLLPNFVAMVAAYAINHYLNPDKDVGLINEGIWDLEQREGICDNYPDKPNCDKIVDWLADVIESCPDELGPFVKMNVGQFLFNGVQSCLLTKLNDLEGDVIPIDLPETFSLFGEDNNTVEGEYVVFTGEDDLRKRAQIYSFDGLTTNDGTWVEGSTCDQIIGTDGELWRPFASTEDTVHVWSGDIKRSLPFEYDKTVRVKDCLGYSYLMPANVFNNSETNPANSCYEEYPRPDGELLPDGVYHYRSIPLAMSSPHYLNADSSWSEQIDGMHPVQKLHESKFVVEPVTGTPLEVQISLQGNFHVRRLLSEPGGIAAAFGGNWKSLKDYYHPVLWFTTYSLVDQETADDFILLTEDLEVILNALGGCLVTIGGVLILLVPVLIHFRWEKPSRKFST